MSSPGRPARLLNYRQFWKPLLKDAQHVTESGSSRTMNPPLKTFSVQDAVLLNKCCCSGKDCCHR